MLSPQVIVVGGGLSGLATALALGSSGFQVRLFEARPFLGGRAASYPLNAGDDNSAVIDNCQHVLLRCCPNLLDFYARLGKKEAIQFYREFYWIEPGGRVSIMRSGILPAPLHFSESFARLRFLSLRDKAAIARGMLAVRSDYHSRKDLDRITMLDWLREKKQTPAVIERFWRQVLVSAINEELDVMAAAHGLQVFWLGFLARGDAYEMGVPRVPLSELYGADAWQQYPNIQISYRASVQSVAIENCGVQGVLVNDEKYTADAYVLAVPFERLSSLAPDLPLDLTSFRHSPITGIHLWFDQPITDLPHATLLDRTIQWMFNKEGGKHIQVVVSASRQLLEMSRADVIDLAVRELTEFFPAVRDAKLDHAHVVKEVRATFSAGIGLEEKRPGNQTAISGLFLAGDWTRSGWPATMEGAVRSGYLAAEAVAKSLGKPIKALLPDIA